MREGILSKEDMEFVSLRKKGRSCNPQKDLNRALLIIETMVAKLDEYRQDYAKVHDICQRDRLGLGGENIIDLLIAAYTRLSLLNEGQIKRIEGQLIWMRESEASRKNLCSRLDAIGKAWGLVKRDYLGCVKIAIKLASGTTSEIDEAKANVEALDRLIGGEPCTCPPNGFCSKCKDKKYSITTRRIVEV